MHKDNTHEFNILIFQTFDICLQLTMEVYNEILCVYSYVDITQDNYYYACKDTDIIF